MRDPSIDLPSLDLARELIVAIDTDGDHTDLIEALDAYGLGEVAKSILGEEARMHQDVPAVGMAMGVRLLYRLGRMDGVGLAQRITGRPEDEAIARAAALLRGLLEDPEEEQELTEKAGNLSLLMDVGFGLDEEEGADEEEDTGIEDEINEEFDDVLVRAATQEFMTGVRDGLAAAVAEEVRPTITSHLRADALSVLTEAEGDKPLYRLTERMLPLRVGASHSDEDWEQDDERLVMLHAATAAYEDIADESSRTLLRDAFRKVPTAREYPVQSLVGLRREMAKALERLNAAADDHPVEYFALNRALGTLVGEADVRRWAVMIPATDGTRKRTP